MSENACGKADSRTDATDKDSSVPVYQREDWLREQYWENELSTYEMAELAGTCKQTILNWMERCNVENRGAHKRSSIRQTNATPKLSDKGWLREKYCEEGLTTIEIAEQVDVTPEAVTYWMDKFGIEARSGYMDVLRGKKHPLWKGGHEKYYGPNWTSQRKRALGRDNYKCQRCGLGRRKSREDLGRDLDVHHITPIIEFDDKETANKLSNLISLCRKCHWKLEGVPIDNR